MPYLDDLVTVLEGAGAGTFNTDLFLRNSNVPFLPSGALSVNEYPGGAPLRTQNSVLLPGYVQPRAQIMARCANADRAYEKAMRAFNALVGVRNTFINSGWYREINPLQVPFPMGMDDNKQYRFAFNVEAVKRPEVVV